MSVSPVITKARENKPLSPADFNKQVDHFRDAIRAIVCIENERTKHGANHRLDVKGHEIGKKEIARFWKALLHQMNSLKKFYAMKKKNKSGKNSTQLRALHYISDQMVSLYDGADLGPLDPSDPNSPPLSDALGLLTEKHMGNAGILTSLYSRYIRHNNLKRTSGEDGEQVRYIPDKRMKSALSTTEWLFFGEKIADRDYPDNLPDDKIDKIKESVKYGNKSAFARVSDRVSGKNEDELVYDKKKGALYVSMMMFNSFYRILPELNTQEERDALKDEENIAAAIELNNVLKNITRYYNEQDKKSRGKNSSSDDNE